MAAVRDGRRAVICGLAAGGEGARRRRHRDRRLTACASRRSTSRAAAPASSAWQRSSERPAPTCSCSPRSVARTSGNFARALGMHATFGQTWRLRPFGNAILTKGAAPSRPARAIQPHARPSAARDGCGTSRLGSHDRGDASGSLVGRTVPARERDRRSVVPRPRPRRDRRRSERSAHRAAVIGVLLHRFRDSFPAVGPEQSLTYPADAPPARIDYVLVSGLEVRDAAVLPPVASDHLAVVVEIG